MKPCLKLPALIWSLSLPTGTICWAPYSARHLQAAQRFKKVVVNPARSRQTHLLAFKTKKDESKTVSDFDESTDISERLQGGVIEASTESTESTGMDALKEKIFLGIEPTPEVLSIMAIYFVEGALGLARLAQTFFLKDELHLGPAEMSALTGLFTLPWTIKVSNIQTSILDMLSLEEFH